MEIPEDELGLAVRNWAGGAEKACLISCFVQPRASRNQILGVHGGELKIQLTTPPVEGRANKDLCTFWAKILHVSKSSVQLKSGGTSRHKVLMVSNVSAEDVMKVIGEL